jgi:hypothetical protein
MEIFHLCKKSILKGTPMLKSFWFWLFMIFIVMQFFSLDVPAKLPIDKKEEIQAPKEVMQILKRSCYDCHSSEVNAPWYYYVAPSSWYTQLHVKNGRKIVNFSKWNSYNREKKLKILKKIDKAIVIRMPLLTYTYLHPEAKLTNSEKKILKKWARDLKEQVK